jgi:hypothetical protein
VTIGYWILHQGGDASELFFFTTYPDLGFVLTYRSVTQQKLMKWDVRPDFDGHRCQWWPRSPSTPDDARGSCPFSFCRVYFRMLQGRHCLVLTGGLDSLETQPDFRLLFDAVCPDSLTSFLTKFLRQWDQQLVPNANGRLPHLTRTCKATIDRYLS